MAVLVISLVVLLAALYFFLRHKLNFWKNLGVPCDSGSLLLGNLDGVGQHVHMNTKIQNMYEKFKFANNYFGFFFLQDPRLILIDLDLIKNVTIKDFDHFVDRGMYVNEEDDPLSGHLFSIAGEKWRVLRNKLSPTFTSGKMKMMFETMAGFTDGLVKLVEEENQNMDGIDIKNVAVRYTADIIGSCGFGLEVNALKDKNAEMLSVSKFFDFKETKAKLNQFVLVAFPNISKLLKLRVMPKHISDFFLRVIKQTYDHRQQNSDTIHRNDFMNLLMQIQKYGKLKDEESETVGTLTFNELAAQAFIFFIAGFETSSTLMYYVMYELAYHQGLQDKVRKEVKEMHKKHGGFTYDAMMAMTYLDKVLNETLRKYPPVPTLLRECVMDYKIPGSDLELKKGTGVLIPVHAIHHDSRYYRDPERFDPERFSPEAERERPNMAFLPFGVGPRNCVGMRFGLMQSKLGIAAMINSFVFTHNERTSYPTILDPEDFMWNPLTKISLDAKRI